MKTKIPTVFKHPLAVIVSSLAFGMLVNFFYDKGAEDGIEYTKGKIMDELMTYVSNNEETEQN